MEEEAEDIVEVEVECRRAAKCNRMSTIWLSTSSARVACKLLHVGYYRRKVTETGRVEGELPMERHPTFQPIRQL